MTADPFTIPTATIPTVAEADMVAEACTRLLAADDSVGAHSINHDLSVALLDLAAELEDLAAKHADRDDDEDRDDTAKLVASILLGHRPDLVDAARDAR